MDLITSIEVIQDIIKILRVEQHLVPLIEVVMAIMHEVIKGMEDMAIMEEVVTEIKLIIEEGVGHLKDRIEVGEMKEVRVTAGLSQVLGQVQIETEFNASNVESMIILCKNVQLDYLGKLVGEPNKSNSCLIWMRTKH